MVPVRVISEGLGARLFWDDKSRKVTIKHQKSVIVLTINSSNAFVIGKVNKLQQPAMIAKGTTLVPLRFIAENLGLSVRWNQSTQTVHLSSTKTVTAGSNDPATTDTPAILPAEPAVPATPTAPAEPAAPPAPPVSQPVAAQTPVVKKPAIFIYHSHNRESWLSELPGVTNPDSAYDTSINVTLLGARMADRLRVYGAEVYHSSEDYETTYQGQHDYFKSYEYSAQTIRTHLASHPETKYLFDLHRDASSRIESTANIGGTSYAKLYFIIGTENPNWKENEAFAKKIEAIVEAKYPGISRGIRYKGKSSGNGVYNQNFSPTSALIEIGGVYNTLEESDRTIDILADAINEIR
jgi:stage II sporulation protein P